MAHRLSPDAEAELDETWWYIAGESGSIDRAQRVVGRITESFDLLAGQPHMGRARDDLRVGLRSHTVANNVILYRVDGADVVIVHVFHSRRDIDSLLG